MTTAEFNDWMHRGRSYLTRRFESSDQSVFDDVVSDVIWKMIDRGGFEARNPVAYFYSAVKNRMIDELRSKHRGRSVSLEALGEVAAPDDCEGVVDRLSDVSGFREAFEQLTIGQRRALELKAQGFSCQEIAKMEGGTITAAKKRRHHAYRKMLRLRAEQAV